MASPVALITDSTCDIPADLLQRYDIRVIPQVIIWGDQQLRDRVDITPKDFYPRLESDPVYPSTTLPHWEDMLSAYQGAVEAGAERLLVLTVSRAMSGTFQLARQAAQELAVPVDVVDSHGPTMSLGWQVLAAARLRDSMQEGDPATIAQAMVERAGMVRERLASVVCLDTLEYLHRGGRIGGATRFIGALLNIKPLVVINHDSGEVEALGRARTRRKGIELMYRQFFSRVDTARPLHIAVLHGAAQEDAEALVERIRRDYHPLELLINITGPVLGIHTGPGALAVCGYSESW
jgi:DegV family protein with EDD domain